MDSSTVRNTQNTQTAELCELNRKQDVILEENRRLDLVLELIGRMDQNLQKVQAGLSEE